GSPQLQRAITSLRRQTGGEVFIFDGSSQMLAGTDLDGHDKFPEVPRALRNDQLVSRLGREAGGSEAQVAVPLKTGDFRGVLDMRRSLASLGSVQAVVRRSLVAAAFVAL